MLFNSYVFILAFLPITLIGYFLLGKIRARSVSKIWLVGCSLFFYAYFNPAYLPIIVLSVLVNFALSQLMLRTEKKPLRVVLLLIGLAANLGVLGYYKYYDFFASSLNEAFGTSFTLLNLVLPLGISFFTFQQLSYVIDSYRKSVPSYRFLDYALFVTFCPQLIAGPIVLHREIVPQFADEKSRKFDLENFGPGFYAFAMGLGKKVLIADTFAKVADIGFAPGATMNTPIAWLTALAYCLQLYFDFSGYCDMAVGLGLMFNIRIPQNFHSPYQSLDIREFWQRWHMTLSRFFTTYVYFPLGGSRKGIVRTCLNLMVVFLVSGLWHGAGWLFIFWGFLHGAASVLYRLFRKPYDRLHPALRWLMTFLFITIAWVFFRAPSWNVAINIVTHLFNMTFAPIDASFFDAFALPMRLLPGYTHILALVWYTAAIVACLGMRNVYEKTMDFTPSVWRCVATVLVLVYSILSLSGVSVFLYFNF